MADRRRPASEHELEPKDGVLFIRANPKYLRRWTRAAKACGLTLSTYVRFHLDEQADADLDDAGSR